MIDVYASLIVLVTTASVIFLSETQSKLLGKLLDWVPPILFAYMIPAMAVRFFDLDAEGTILPNWSKNYLVPLAILLLMTSLSIGQLKLVGWRPIAVFVSGSCWIAVFPFLYYLAFYNHSDSIMLDYWKGIPPIVGSWIGGSTSQVVLKEVVACPESLFLTVLVIDNILVNLWTILMFQAIKRTPEINKWLRISDEIPPLMTATARVFSKEKSYFGAVAIFSIYLCSSFLPISFLQKIIFLSFTGLLLSPFFSAWDQKMILRTGHVIIIVIMAVLGLRLDFENFSLAPVFVLFLVVWLVSHYVFMVFVAKLLRVNAVWIPIASMANVGGIATTPAVTATYNKELMPHAVILAVLSMVSGTAWGGLTIWLFSKFISV